VNFDRVAVFVEGLGGSLSRLSNIFLAEQPKRIPDPPSDGTRRVTDAVKVTMEATRSEGGEVGETFRSRITAAKRRNTARYQLPQSPRLILRKDNPSGAPYATRFA